MESEKVKEIKKALEDNANYEHHDKLGYIDGYKCKTVAYADILTLINELESENERLENKNYQLAQDLGQCENGYKLELHTARYQLHSANEDLKKAEKRIAELENQMCRNEDLHTATEKLNDTIVLKQFAERLKEKFDEQKHFYETASISHRDISLTALYTAYKYLDETLKEYEK